MQELSALVNRFVSEEDVLSIEAFGAGHINTTYLVKTAKSEFLLQQVNTGIFQRTEVIFHNFSLLKNLVTEGVIVPYIAAPKGTYSLVIDGQCWRLQPFITDTFAPDRVSTTDTAYQVARGFALFNKGCLNLSVDSFEQVILRFHDLEWRLEQLDFARQKATDQRLDSASELLGRFDAFRGLAQEMKALVSQGLPLRVCHNDTKANNILLDSESSEFRKVIDLDTVGPGYLLYDFGDMMRTILSDSTESEIDVSKVMLRPELFLSLAAGYLSILKPHITESEKKSLVFGGLYMTYIMGVRFLADYLNGDVYYKTSFDNENFIRARNQLLLLEQLNDHKHDFESIINRHG